MQEGIREKEKAVYPRKPVGEGMEKRKGAIYPRKAEKEGMEAKKRTQNKNGTTIRRFRLAIQ